MKVRFILFFVVAFAFSACKKKAVNPVPFVPFDQTININLPSYNGLTGVGGWAYLNGGSKGIVIYRKSIDEFVAFDRHSPADGGNCDTPLEPNADNFLQLDDLCSGAKFSLYDGSPLDGGQFGLRSYQTFWDGVENLRIYN